MINFVGSFHYTAWMALALFFLISCNYLLMILVGTILEKPRLQGISLLLFCVLSTLLCCAVANSLHMTMGVWYSLLGLVLLTEFYIFHQDGFVKTLFITLSCVVHLLAMRAICVAVLAMIGQKNFFTIVNNGDTFWLSTALTALVADVAIILVLKFIPKGKIKIIGQYKEQLWFMLAWQILYATYFIFTARVYNIDLAYPFLNSIQIATSVTVLLGAYIVLFFSFTTTSLLGYKDKNLVLELEIEKQQQYRASMLTDAITSFEFNLSKNEIISGLDAYQAAFGHQGTYNQVLIFAAQHVVHYDDLIAFIEHVNVARVMEMYNKGKNEISIEYRRLLDTGDYIWVRSTTNLMRDHSSGDVKAFTYVRNIDEEKKARLALEYKAERDVLTGLCNKAMLVQLISDYLHQVETISGAGTLFMVDIDDFKNINDSLGHVYGDAVLRELGEKLSKCFREDDIVGRLGGDEFMALMKGAHHTKAIEEKALEICKAFHNS